MRTYNGDTAPRLARRLLTTGSRSRIATDAALSHLIVRTFDEKTTWNHYNLIREIECTSRQLKTNLNLRPTYHQRDDRSDDHLFLGMPAYWVVNTIRHQLKEKGEKTY